MSQQNLVAINASAEGPVKGSTRPDLPARLFWEYDYETIDWNKAAVIVIERVLDRGNSQEFEAMVRFYGREKVVDVLRNKTVYLMDHSMKRACAYFGIYREELFCYWRKWLKQSRWL